MNTIIEFIKKHKIIFSLAIIIVIGGGYWLYRSQAASQETIRYVTSTLEKGTLTVSVSGTGQVSPTNTLEIKPQVAGKIISVKAVQGATVKTGDVLVSLDPKEARQQLHSAQASLAQAQSSYDKLVGPTASNNLKSAQLTLSEAQRKLALLQDADKTNTTEEQAITTAQADLAQAKLDSQNTIDQKESDLVTNIKSKFQGVITAADALKKIFDDQALSSTIGAGNSAALTSARYSYQLLQSKIDAAQPKVAALSTVSDQSSMQAAYQSVQDALSVGIRASNDMFTTMQATFPSSSVTQAQIDSYKSSVSSQSTSLTTASTALQTANQAVADATTAYTTNIRKAEQTLNQATINYKNAIETARNSVTNAQLQLSSTQANTSTAEVSAARAQIASAAAQVETAQDNLSNTTIKAPFDGEVATVAAKVGDQATATTAVVTLITKQKLAKITLNETDVAKVKIGQKASISFDAIDNLTIAGTVAQVDVIGTLTQNVVSYNIDISFDTDSDLIKPGMSASASIITDVKQDILLAPSTAVKTDTNGSYVQILKNGAPENRAVTVGLSNDSETEVSGDVEEGEEIITQTISSKTTDTTQSANSLLNLGGATRSLQGGGNFQPPTGR